MSEEEWEPRSTKFRRKRNVVEAYRLTEDNAKEVAKWCGGEALKVAASKYVANMTDPLLRVPTLNEPLVVWFGEWVVKNEDGRYSVMDNKEFVADYEQDSDDLDGEPLLNGSFGPKSQSYLKPLKEEETNA